MLLYLSPARMPVEWFPPVPAGYALDESADGGQSLFQCLFVDHGLTASWHLKSLIVIFVDAPLPQLLQLLRDVSGNKGLCPEGE